jgi:hypothetical protein
VSGPGGLGGTGAGRPEDADQPLDELDGFILAGVRGLYSRADPPPPDLDTRVLFALALDTVEDEVARLQEETLVGSGPRGTRSRTLTFAAAGTELMIAVTDISQDQVRVDGWVVPAGPGRVEFRLAGGPPDAAAVQTAAVDASGRFTVSAVRRGLVQLRVRPAAPGSAGLVTTAFTLLRADRDRTGRGRAVCPWPGREPGQPPGRGRPAAARRAPSAG